MPRVAGFHPAILSAFLPVIAFVRRSGLPVLHHLYCDPRFCDPPASRGRAPSNRHKSNPFVTFFHKNTTPVCNFSPRIHLSVLE